MVKGWDAADLGPFGILVMSWNIFHKNAKSLLLIQLCLGLPSAILNVGVAVLLLSYEGKSNTLLSIPLIRNMSYSTVESNSFQSSVGSPSDLTLNHGTFGTSGPKWVDIIFRLIISDLGSIILLIAQSFSVAANILAVGFVNADRVVSCGEVMKTAIPNLWKSLVVTLLFFQMVVKVLEYSYIGASVSMLSGNFLIPLLVIILLLLISIDLSTMYPVASAVSVLEEERGMAAFTRARKLMKQKWWTAFFVQLLVSLPIAGLNLGVILWLQPQISESMTVSGIARNWMFYFVLTNLIIFNTLFSLMSSISAGVTYFSFRAFHEPTIPSAIVPGGAIITGFQYFKDKTFGSANKDGYDPLADSGSDDVDREGYKRKENFKRREAVFETNDEYNSCV